MNEIYSKLTNSLIEQSLKIKKYHTINGYELYFEFSNNISGKIKITKKLLYSEIEYISIIFDDGKQFMTNNGEDIKIISKPLNKIIKIYKIINK